MPSRVPSPMWCVTACLNSPDRGARSAAGAGSGEADPVGKFQPDGALPGPTGPRRSAHHRTSTGAYLRQGPDENPTKTRRKPEGTAATGGGLGLRRRIAAGPVQGPRNTGEHTQLPGVTVQAMARPPRAGLRRNQPHRYFTRRQASPPGWRLPAFQVSDRLQLQPLVSSRRHDHRRVRVPPMVGFRKSPAGLRSQCRPGSGSCCH
jgi:hypothetical protein